MVGVDGSLWTWEPPTSRGCESSTVAAVRARLPSVTQLGAPLNHDPPNARYAERAMCPHRRWPRCWPTEAAKPMPIVPFDPTAL